MKSAELVKLRLHNQLLTQHPFETPAEVVRWMVAMQAQDYFGALWAVGMRMPAGKITQVEQAFERGEILRTHLMRPTWHFVAAEDLRWLVRLTAPRVHAANAYMVRQQKLDAKVLAKAAKVIEAALSGRNLSRNEISEALTRKGIVVNGLRLIYILMHSELELLICSGPRRGKQFTYALVDERAPQESKAMDRKEALAQFARRYFASRGPATIRDIAYWSGLSTTDAKAGLEAIKAELETVTFEEEEYWVVPGPDPKKATPGAYLLSNYDEYGMAYKERGAMANDPDLGKLYDYSFSHTLMQNGLVLGSWRREITKGGVIVWPRPAKALSPSQKKAFDQAAKRYARFLGQPVQVQF